MLKPALCRLALVVAAFCLMSIPVRLVAGPDNDDGPTTTPIKHVVVIFQENVSFDHYFGTYPHALLNNNGTIYFGTAKDDTPRVNNLESSGLLTNNPNGVNPFRIDRSVPNTCDQDHNYGDEQKAFHGGLMDNFLFDSCNDPVLGRVSTMGYYDGNTVTALWNYAQHFAMSDNHFGTTFGPSTPGLLNLVAGNTFEGTITNGLSGSGNIAGGNTVGAVVGDPDPAYDKCSNPARTQISISGQNIGNLLSNAGVTWGSFMGGFSNCAAETTGLTGLHSSLDYIPHHAFFQYWQSTSNPGHLPPSSVGNIGKQDQANHQYDLSAFAAALQAHNLPAVSFIKAPAYQDGHAGYSDPLDEQFFLVNFINMLEKSEEWNETAVFITWDDSDGWYDHQMGPISHQSNVSDLSKPSSSDADQLLGPGNCGTAKPIPGTTSIQNGRCGLGPRIPFLVISPWTKQNYVDHRVIDQSSIIHFIEDNWNLGRIGNGSTDAESGMVNGMFDFDNGPRAGKLFLDPATGAVVGSGNDDPRRDQR
ncbi:MAG TPA: alkaline phosphatase family protein [Candidatus Acidoferrales bacterium]|nr:alkaline phosphatase family protein [Candidatus Acidoferrales bacterium]